MILSFWSLSVLVFFSIFQIYKFGKDLPPEKSIFSKLSSNLIKHSVDIFTVFYFEIILAIQSLLMCLLPIPWLSDFLYHFHFSFFLSFLIFDFKWTLMGWSTQKKIDFIETRCMYFFGFGLVLSILFNWPGSLIYNTTFSTFFIPIIFLNGILTKCEHLEGSKVRFPVFDFQIPIFKILGEKKFE